MTGPTAEVSTPGDVTAPTVSPYTFVVHYADDTGIWDSTLDSNDVRVTAPDGSSVLAQFAGAIPDPAGSGRLATYVYTPPAGGFTAAMNGAYTVSVETDQVFDTSGNAAAAGPLGTFSVNIPNNAPNLVVGSMASTLKRGGTVAVGGRPRGAVWFTVSTIGTQRVAGPVAFSLVASADPVLDANDVEIASATRRIVLGPGRNRRITLHPRALPAALQVGDYYLLARVDATDAVAETNENDNVTVSASPALHVVAAGTSLSRKRESLFGVEPVGVESFRADD